MQTIQRSVAPPVTHANRSSANSVLPAWVRVGLPALLAMLAGMLNANTVRQQLNPIQAYALASDVSPGVKLRPEHLQLVTVGGNLDRTKLFTEDDLLTMLKIEDGSTQTIQVALVKTPLIFSKPVGRGELLSGSCLGGMEKLGAGEGRIHVPVSNILGDCSVLLPGQVVYFNATTSDSEKAYTKIGPFRIPFAPRKEVDEVDDALLPLVYKLGPNGEQSESTQRLFAAAHSKHGTKLAIIEESPRTLIRESQGR